MVLRGHVALTVVTVAALVSVILLAHSFEYNAVPRPAGLEYIKQKPDRKVMKPICPPNQTLSGVEDLLCMKIPTFMSDYKNPCWRRKDGQLRCLPYFMLIGMDKSGSSDLFDRITKHPDILGNGGEIGKETWWWSWSRYGYNLINRVKTQKFEDYLNLFKHSTQTINSPNKTDSNGFHFAITGDGTPMDAWDFRGWTQIPQNKGLQEPKFLTPDLVQHVNKNMKLIIIMRNPIERLYSDYFFLKLAGQSSEAFHNSVVASIDILGKCLSRHPMLTCLSGTKEHQCWNRAARIHIGFYSEYVLEWLRVFPRDQILFLRTEDYSADLSGHLAKVFSFLGSRPLTASEITSYGIDLKTKKHVTQSKKTKGPMLEKTRAILSTLYEPYNKKLANILQDNRFLWKDSKAR
ncbi:carbohydrate sulfotransferase 15-like [Mizuhopecten yessoensis]|uniref:carbohydrate sulfotransferase 15-like n=1 Tax=Mizuhopecten yessoensis TaxID=6573 RepID=UPI000B45B851|nr:carbohydrate sulfotransferase 15-like [Mizuhopecten yessoensis]